MKDKQKADRVVWLGFLRNHIKKGKIAEFGCGGGFVTEMLVRDYPNSIIISIDKDEKRLLEIASKDFKNVIAINADITKNIFTADEFDTALFIGVLHEIYSYSGPERVVDVLRFGYNALKDRGVLIIQDFLKPEPQLVELIFKNEPTKEKFYKFANEFKQRKIKFKEIYRGVEIDIADAIEFISKYRSLDEEDWQEEIRETHFCFTEKQYKQFAAEVGFRIVEFIKLPKSEVWRQETSEDMKFSFLTEFRWIQMVLTKPRTHLKSL